MERMEKKGKKKDVSDFAATKNKIGARDKSDFAKGFVPKKKDVSDFAVNTKTKKVKKVSANGNKTKTTKTSKPKVVTPKMIRDAGFTELRDYLNFKQGKTRRDGKKPVRVGDKKKVTNVVKKKTNGSKKVMVDSFKKSNVFKNKKSASKTGVNGAATTKKKTNGGKTGFGTKAMTTKTKKTFKGTNITPTKSQRQQMRKRMMGST